MNMFISAYPTVALVKTRTGPDQTGNQTEVNKHHPYPCALRSFVRGRYLE